MDAFKEMKKAHRVWRAQRCETEAGEIGRGHSMQDIIDHVRKVDLYSRMHKKPLKGFKLGSEMIGFVFSKGYY